MGGGLSQLLEEVFLGDVVPEANLGDNVVQRSLGYQFVHRGTVMLCSPRGVTFLRTTWLPLYLIRV